MAGRECFVMNKPGVDEFGGNIWVQAIYDLRNLLLPEYPKSARGSIPYKKTILSVILGAGIPTAQYKNAGYKKRLEILAQQTGMNVKALQRHISDLETMNLLTSKGIGPNLPKLRVVNHEELHRVVSLQRQDLRAWMDRHKDASEDSPRLLFVPEDYHLRISNPWGVPSSTTLDTHLDTQLDAPIGAHLVTQLVNQEEESISECLAQHGQGLSCANCDVSVSKDYSQSAKESDPWDS